MVTLSKHLTLALVQYIHKARLLNYGVVYRKQIWQAAISSVLNKVFDLAPPVLIGTAVDVVVKKQDSVRGAFGNYRYIRTISYFSVFYGDCLGIRSVFEYAYKRLWRNLSQQIQHNLRLDAYNDLQELELAYFEERSTGGLMSILSDDINQLERFLDGGASDIIQAKLWRVQSGLK